MSQDKRPTPRQRLKNLSLTRFAFVDQGDNPGAHLLLSKRREDDMDPTELIDPDPPHEGEGPAIEPQTEKRTWVDRVNDWVLGKSRAQKNPFTGVAYEPRTTAEIMAEDQFRDRFWNLKNAFSRSINSIMDMAPSDETPGLLGRTVEEFTDEMRSISSDVTKGHPDAEKVLLEILKRLDNAVGQSGSDLAKSREQFAAAMAALDEYEPPELTTEDALPATKKNNLDDILKALGDDDRSVVEAALAEKAGDKKPAFLMGDKDKKDEKAGKAAPSEDEALKALPESVRKRLESAEKAAADATAKAEALEEAAKAASYVAKAKSMGVDGVDIDTLAKAIRMADEAEGGEAIKTMISALAAQAKKGGALLKSLGTERSEDGSDAEKQVEKAVANLRKSKPDLSYAQAYTEVLRENPGLYAEMDSEYQEEAA